MGHSSTAAVRIFQGAFVGAVGTCLFVGIVFGYCAFIGWAGAIESEVVRWAVWVAPAAVAFGVVGGCAGYRVACHERKQAMAEDDGGPEAFIGPRREG